MASTPFLRRGITKVFIVPTVTLAAPTAVQVNAGTELTTATKLADLTGLSYTNQPLTVPDWSTTIDSKIPGPDQVADCVLTFNDKKGSGGTTYVAANPERATLAKGTVTNLVVFPAGIAGSTPAAGDYCDVWPVVSSGPSKVYSYTEDAKWHVTLPASGAPTQDVALV